MKPVTAPAATWRDPRTYPPPLAKKILLLTYTGTACIGCWGEGFIAWAPLPKIPPLLKTRIGISHENPVQN